MSNGEGKKVALGTMVAACVMVGTICLGIMGFAWKVSGDNKYVTLLEQVIEVRAIAKSNTARITGNDILIYGLTRDVKYLTEKIDEVLSILKGRT